MTGGDLPPLVVVSVGTDTHPFDRLIRWVDDWAAQSRAARVFVQHGSSEPPRHSEGRAMLPPQELAALMRQAAVVVTHGGPGTIAASRAAGRLPVVVARQPDLGEHVDDHQLRFVARQASGGNVLAPATESDLRRMLDRAVADPAAFALKESSNGDARDAATRFEALIDGLVDDRTATPLRVLYVGGWGRSGSTLLDRMLGQIPGVVSTGELRDVWLRGVVENRLCGCGEAFRSCSVWKAVGDEAFGGWDRLDIAVVQGLRLRFDRPWSPPRVLLSMLTPELDADVERYVDHLSRLYRAIACVTGGRVIVDSSKIPTYAVLLRRIPGIDLRVLHLIRDSRGVVFSWQKRVARADGGDRDRMIRYGAAGASLRYVTYNGLTHGLRTLDIPSKVLRYEDLIADPRRHVVDTLRFAGVTVDDDDLAFLGDGRADLAPNHTVDGNPMRLRAGSIPLLVDDAWRRQMDPGRRALVTALTAPMLAMYGYPVRG